MKYCSRCTTNKEDTDFYTKSGKGKPQTWCKKCVSNYSTERQRKIKQQAIEYKGGKCNLCGYDRFAGALEFHHLDPSKKDFGISAKPIVNFEKMKDELDKCLLLCSNCHREIHAKLVFPAGIEPALPD